MKLKDKQQYILFVKYNDTSNTINGTNALARDQRIKIKQAYHYIGGVPPTFNKTCIPFNTTSMLGFLRKTSFSLTNLTLAYGTSETTKEHLEFKHVWVHTNGYLKVDCMKKSIKSLSFDLRPTKADGLIMSLDKFDVHLVNYNITITSLTLPLNYTFSTPLKENELNSIGLLFNNGIVVINGIEEKIEKIDRVKNHNPIRIGGFDGGIYNIMISNELLWLNSTTVKEFSEVEIGRERPLSVVTNKSLYKSLLSNLTNSMQNTEGCASFANYITDPDAIKFGDKPNSYTLIKNNFWRNDSKLSFQFRTFYPNGLLFITLGNNRQQHYNLLELKEGKLTLIIKGRKKKEVPFPQKLNDGEWHNIDITKYGRKMTITVDKEQRNRRISKNKLGDRTYLGSIPSSLNLNINDLADKLHPFRGCMRSLILNNEHKFLIKNNKDVTHSNIRQCFPNIEEGAYFGGDAYAVYKDNFQVSKILELSFQFRTAEQNGILLSVSNSRNSPALSVELQNGAVVMAVDMGNGAVSNVTNNLDSDFALCNNMWHNVTAIYSTSELTVNVDGITKTWVQPYSLMDEIEAPLYIGGLKENEPIGTLKTRENFKGCIRKLKIEDKLMDWSDMKDLNNVLLNSCPVQWKNNISDKNNLEITNYTLIT